MIRLIPGDAVAIMLGANTEITPDRIAELRDRLGLDDPLVVQYGHWLWRALHGDLGTSIWTGRPVLNEISVAIWPTVELAALSVLVGAGLSIPIGAFMAQARGGAAEVAVRVGAIAGLTIPSFWLGIVSIFLVAKLLPGVSALGYVPFTENPLGNLQRMVLPVIALSLPMLANLSRLVRSAMLDALGQDYVRTARAKGASRRRVVYRHALRNALIPFVTSVGVSVGYLLGGAIVVEQVFAIPGLGRLVLGAISERNYPLVQATILVITATFVLVNFAVDLLYAAIDPRVTN
ncbi:MAG: glutathione ABC transporter permease GsiC [Alphaproteobacteria bacterium HGW-Alphaproteobacteria-4]|nr:MAG: glutathione ABC transporter permease GsiC [Alphaproteobacteria bacterium HGW-Alphaproteobacteria-4]